MYELAAIPDNNHYIAIDNPDSWPAWWYDDAEFEARIQPYLTRCEEERIPITGAALAQQIGLQRLEFALITKNNEILTKMPKNIKKLVNLLQSTIEIMLTVRGGGATGPMFLAKQYGYTDTHNVNITHRTMGQTLANLIPAQIVDPENGST